MSIHLISESKQTGSQVDLVGWNRFQAQPEECISSVEEAERSYRRLIVQLFPCQSVDVAGQEGHIVLGKVIKT